MAISTASPAPVPSLMRPGLLARMLQLVLAAGVGSLCYQLAPLDFRLLTRLIMGWDGFVLSVLLLSWLTIFRSSTADMRRRALLMHPDRTWILLLTLTFIGTTISLLAVMLMLRGLHEMVQEERIEHILVSVAAVMTTWCLLHTLFALHYAHTYFHQQQQGLGAGHQSAGLVFSGDEPTSYWDFAYFAFVIGMTAQTSDVMLTSLRMRRLVLFHSMLAFGFNTAILALSINILSGVL